VGSAVILGGSYYALFLFFLAYIIRCPKYWQFLIRYFIAAMDRSGLIVLGKKPGCALRLSTKKYLEYFVETCWENQCVSWQ